MTEVKTGRVLIRIYASGQIACRVGRSWYRMTRGGRLGKAVKRKVRGKVLRLPLIDGRMVRV